MYGLLNYIVGYICILIRGDGALTAINTLHAEGLRIRAITPVEGGFTVRHSVFGADNLIGRLESLGVPYEIKDRGGLSFAASKYIKRTGLWAGLLLALIILYGSTCLIWDVRVECSGECNEKEVLIAMEQLGVYVGAYTSGVDVYKAEQTFLAQNGAYSDIAINMQGTVAVIKLRLSSGGQHADVDNAPSDIVASEAGVVRKITAVKGEPSVAAGDTVAKGDLLISGAVTGKYGAIYLHPAEGSVTATVYRDFQTVIPLETTVKCPTGKVETKTAYTVLGKELRLFGEEISPFAKADLSVASERISLFGLSLPVVKETVTYIEYTEASLRLTEAAAREKALASFRAYLERETEGRVVDTVTELYYNEELDVIVLNATATLEAEIGERAPIKPPSP